MSDVFRQLLIDRLGNAHRLIVDRYSLGHKEPHEIAETDSEIAAVLRDAATYLRQTGTGNPASSSEIGSVPSEAP